MPRRSILSTAERESLLAFPAIEDELIRHYTLSESDLSVISQHRLGQNRLGFAIQLCYLRHPGILYRRTGDHLIRCSPPWRANFISIRRYGRNTPVVRKHGVNTFWNCRSGSA